MVLSEKSAWEWITRHISTLDATGGVKPFPDYDFARELVETLCHNRILIVGKSRQMMATWTVTAWIIWKAIHDDPGVYLLLSKGERDTLELVKRIKVMVVNLPDELKDQVRVKNKEVDFANGSRILPLPATEFAPRMHSPSGVFWDEMAFTPNSEGIWAAVKPAIDSGGCFIGVSTPNGTDNVFYQLYSDETNGFSKLKLHWKQHPMRGEEWLNEAKRGISEARWRQEYEVDFDVLADRVYDEFDPEVHVLPQPYKWSADKGKTYRGIDFGYRHPYVVWVQVSTDGALTVFDEWEGSDCTVGEMEAAIRRIDARNGLSEKQVTWSACDPAGAAASDTGVSAVDRLSKSGYKLFWRSSEIMTGIELVKSLLRDAAGKVRLRFSPAASRTIHHLRHYRWESAKDRPLKDNEHDHAMDALRYLVINMFGQKPSGWTKAQVKGAKW